MRKSPIFCLMGPTAIGKTALACRLVDLFPIEIISVDSAMIYRDMTIGTAKPSVAELLHAPHFLIDIIDPPQAFSALEFCKQVACLVKEITDRGKIPLLVGGTMMYYHALQQGLSELPSANSVVRDRITAEADSFGWEAMHARLQQIDPQSAAKIHSHDTQRIQRALEVFAITGKPLSALVQSKKRTLDNNFVNLILYPANRLWLHQQINTRFNQMLNDGFVAEVECLVEKWQLPVDCPAARCVGYRQAMEYLKGIIDKEQFQQQGQAATRQLAKRQLTWLRGWDAGERIVCDEENIQANVVKIAKIIDNSILKNLV